MTQKYSIKIHDEREGGGRKEEVMYYFNAFKNLLRKRTPKTKISILNAPLYATPKE